MEEIVTINAKGAFLILKNMLVSQYPDGTVENVSVVSAKK